MLMLVCCRMHMRRMYGHRSDSSLEMWMVILWLSRGLCKAHRRARKRSSKPLRVSLQDSSRFYMCHTLLFKSHLFDYKYCDWKDEFAAEITSSSVLCLPLKKHLLFLIKLQSVTFFWSKMIRNQYLSKYITSQCSKLSPYFSRFTMVSL